MKLKILVFVMVVSMMGAVELKRAVVDCGGGKAFSQNLSLMASIAQPVIGITGNDQTTLYTGWLWFVQPLTQISENREVFHFALLPSRNLFTGGIMIKFTLPKAKKVKLIIFDASGRVVHKETRSFQPGRNQFVWSSPSPSGIYFFQLKAGSKTLKGKILKIKR